MPPVSLSQEDVDRINAFHTDARNIFIDGSDAPGPTTYTPAQFTAAEYDAFSDGLRNFFRAQMVAFVRIFKNGPTKFPTQLPSYPKASLPSAGANTGCMIFVTDDVGGSIPAFSDGSTWRRVTDRAPIA